MSSVSKLPRWGDFHTRLIEGLAEFCKKQQHYHDFKPTAVTKTPKNTGHMQAIYRPIGILEDDALHPFFAFED